VCRRRQFLVTHQKGDFVKTSRFGGALLALALLFLWGGEPARADDGPVVEEILQVLKDRGIVDDAEYQRLAAKNAKYEAEQNSWMPEIDWSGDFRFRHESWWFDEDETGNERDNRYRIRYRFRLKGVVNINDYSDVVFRLVSGGNDNRSNNKTLGDFVDFDTDDIRLNLVYAKMTAPSSWLPFPDGKAVLELGKVPIPFIWKTSGMKKGKDFMLWDADLAPEGGSLLLSSEPTERSRLFATFGYYIDDENSQAKDPHFWGIQAGGHQEFRDDFVFGARASWYEFRSIDRLFNLRGAIGPIDGDDQIGVTSGAGNIPDGLNGDADGAPFSVVETGSYLTYHGFEAWPITVYGTFARNLDAESSDEFSGVGAEDTAWGVGVEVGDSKKFAKLGAGYWHIEANAFPSMFIDSDFLDGTTNREGWTFYGSRQILKNTEIKLTLFVIDEIEDKLPAFLQSVENADRLRLQSDIVFKF
jgi:hypothetical protein